MVLSLFRRRPDTVDPTHFVVDHDGATFRVALKRRPTARRMTLRVSSATGEIVLTLPSRAAVKKAQSFAVAHGGWIAARLARIPERIACRAGSIVPLRGIPHTIVQAPGARITTRACLDETGEAILVVGGEAAGIPGRVRRFLAAEAARDLGEAVRRYAAALDLAPGRITVRDTRSRWGSCSSAGALSFSWRLILAPPFVLDYLAAHEVAHLREMNHSPRFWALVQGACPHTTEAEDWLKRNGRDLHRYG